MMTITMDFLLQRIDRQALRMAARYTLAHWLLLILLQIENLVLYLPPNVGSTGGVAWWNVPWLQTQNIVVAVMLGLIGYLLNPATRLRWVYLGIYTLVNVALAAEQVYFKLAQSHFRPSMVEGLLSFDSALGSSLAYELDTTFIANLALIALLSAWLARCLRRTHIRATLAGTAPAPHVLRMGGGASLALVLAVGGLHAHPSGVDEIGVHPLMAFVSALERPASTSLPARPTPPSIPAPLAAPLPNSPYSPAPALTTALARAQSSQRPLNIALVVLESVGARQLLDPQGQPRRELAPHLAALGEQAAVFDAVYSVFPGTVRSHVALNTGGRTITWGNVFHDFSHRYLGPTLAGTLRERGYDTALFGGQRLDFENMAGFYSNAGYNTVYDFAKEDPAIAETAAISSWGAKEEYTLERVAQWLDSGRDPSKPFLLTYLSVATHHPYNYPDEFALSSATDERRARYENALRYTDHAIEQLRALLSQRGLLDDTLLVITGDHGQAFGDAHPGNLLHKHFLFDENVRSFLLIANPRLFPASVVTSAPASIGDVMPTLLDLTGGTPNNIPGRSLLRAGPSRPAHFYKNAYPPQWGLRDGPWKFIATNDGKEAALYNLDQDPNEQRNLADAHPERIAHYTRSVSEWYFRTHDQFIALLENYHRLGHRSLTAEDVKTVGPKLLSFGHGSPQKPVQSEFVESARFHPDENIVAWTLWLPYAADTPVTYHWISPSGQIHSQALTVREGWSFTYVGYEGPLPLETGQWRLVLGPDPAKPLIEGNFSVDPDAPLFDPAAAPPVALALKLGYYPDPAQRDPANFIAANPLTPDQRPAVWVNWQPVKRSGRVWYVWRSPSGREVSDYFDMQQGWDQTWVDFTAATLGEAGQWQVSVWSEDRTRRLIDGGFTVEAR